MTIEKKVQNVENYNIDLCHEFGIYQRTDRYTKVRYCDVSKRLPDCKYLSNIRLQVLDDNCKYSLMRICNCKIVYEDLQWEEQKQ